MPAMPEVEVEAKADDESMVEDVIEGGVEEPGEMAGEYIGDMSPDAFKAMLAELLAPVLKVQDMLKNMGDMHTELKGMMGGVATKEQGTQAEIAATKSQVEILAAKLFQIEGNQPAMILPDEVAQALKSAGPAVSDPDQPEIPNDPSRPFAQIAARTMPALYKTGPAGEFAGWTPPPTV